MKPIELFLKVLFSILFDQLNLSENQVQFFYVTLSGVRVNHWKTKVLGFCRSFQFYLINKQKRFQNTALYQDQVFSYHFIVRVTNINLKIKVLVQTRPQVWAFDSISGMKLKMLLSINTNSNNKGLSLTKLIRTVLFLIIVVYKQPLGSLTGKVQLFSCNFTVKVTHWKIKLSFNANKTASLGF